MYCLLTEKIFFNKKYAIITAKLFRKLNKQQIKVDNIAKKITDFWIQ